MGPIISLGCDTVDGCIHAIYHSENFSLVLLLPPHSVELGEFGVGRQKGRVVFLPTSYAAAEALCAAMVDVW
jgi:hypothetical protein